MKYLAALAILAAFAQPALAENGVAPDAQPTAESAAQGAAAPIDAGDVALADFLWVARPVVVFADTPADPAFAEQMRLIEADMDALLERDVVIITDTDPAAFSTWRSALRPRGFMLVLIGKDGNVSLRKARPWNIRELTRAIDKMPLRKQEIRER